MLEVRHNSVQSYIYNTINSRVVVYNYDANDERVIYLLSQKGDTVRHDPIVKYDIQYFDNSDEKKLYFTTNLKFATVMLDGKPVRTFVEGEASLPLAKELKNELEKYGIRLF